jgi:predicted N-formylglutamate amidohydrolase
VTHVRILNRQGRGRFVLLCDHASNQIPVELRNLGLSAADLASHIAWDIGAAAVAEIISDHLDTPAVLCGVSRLVVDCNRRLGSPELMPASSDGTGIPGNVDVDIASREMRIERWFHPYHDAVETLLRERIRQRSMPVVIAIHSMTSVLNGRSRPWPIALSSDADRRLSDLILAALRKPGDVLVGDDEPYRVDPLVDYSIPFHALRRGLLNTQVEFRQDEIDSPAGQQYWAMRLARILQSLQLI